MVLFDFSLAKSFFFNRPYSTFFYSISANFEMMRPAKSHSFHGRSLLWWFYYVTRNNHDLSSWKFRLDICIWPRFSHKDVRKYLWNRVHPSSPFSNHHVIQDCDFWLFSQIYKNNLLKTERKIFPREKILWTISRKEAILKRHVKSFLSKKSQGLIFEEILSQKREKINCCCWRNNELMRFWIGGWGKSY